MDQDQETANQDNEPRVPVPPVPTSFEVKEEVEPAEAEGTVRPARSSYKNDMSRTATDLTGVAEEVIQGKWGAGQDRRRDLEEAGFDPNEVQKEVVRLLNDQDNT